MEVEVNEDVGAELSTSSPQLRLWKSLPRGAFVRLDETNAFARPHVLVALRVRDLIADLPVREYPAGAFEFLRLGLVTCGGITCGYVLRAARCRARVRSNHCVLCVRGEAAVAPSLLFTDATLGIVGDGNGVVACVSHRRWI